MATNNNNNPSVSGAKAKNAAASKAMGSKTPSLSSVLKSNAAKSAAKTSSTPKPKPAPVQYGRGGAYAAPTGAGAISVGNLINDYFSGVKERLAGGAADTGIIPTPATAGIVKPSVGVPPMLQRPAAPAPKPSQAISGTGTRAGGQAKSIYDYLNVDPTAIYAPLVNLVEQQKAAAQDRYTKNLGDITNIFSALTSVAPKDRVRINEQFKNMLTAQQTALAARTAAATEQGQAGAAQAVATGAERGGGEAMALNPLQTATAEGIANANALSTVWSELQGANQAQALADVDARQAGYTAQQAAAVQGLQQSLGDRLQNIAGTEADIQSQLAQQKFGIAQDIGKAKYANALAQQQAAARAAAAQPAKLPAIDKIRAAIGTQRFNALNNQLQTAASRAFADLNAGRTGGTPVKVTGSDVLNAWRAAGGNPDLLNEATTLAKTIYNK